MGIIIPNTIRTIEKTWIQQVLKRASIFVDLHAGVMGFEAVRINTFAYLLFNHPLPQSILYLRIQQTITKKKPCRQRLNNCTSPW